MADFRYSIGDHNGILSLHIAIDTLYETAESLENGTADAHIPIDDLLRSLATHIRPDVPVSVAYQESMHGADVLPSDDEASDGVWGRCTICHDAVQPDHHCRNGGVWEPFPEEK